MPSIGPPNGVGGTIDRVKIATYNINSIRNRLPRLLEWLEAAQPDAVCLQELRIYDEEFPKDEIESAGYGAIWRGQKPRYNGVAILARDTQPVEIRRELPGDRGDVQARYLEAAVNGILIGCLYAPNGNPQPGPKFDYKLNWFERLIAHAVELLALRRPVILAGDYNVVPTDFDIYNPKSWRKDALLQPASRAAYQRLLDQGWLDALRARYPGEAVYTFWDYFRNHWERNAGLRIDHLLLSPEAAPTLVAAGVDRWVRAEHKPSDHAPTWIELGEPARKPGRHARATTAPEPRAKKAPKKAQTRKVRKVIE